MPKYTSFWQTILNTIKAELNPAEPYQNPIINWELPESGNEAWHSLDMKGKTSTELQRIQNPAKTLRFQLKYK